MKRWIFRIAIFLRLGAIVNVAVAWGCVWHAHGNWQLRRRDLYHPSRSEHLERYGWAPTPSTASYRYTVESSLRRSFGYECQHLQEVERIAGEVIIIELGRYTMPGDIASFTSAGWPMRSLHSESWWDYRAEPTRVMYPYGGYSEYPLKETGSVALLSRTLTIAGQDFALYPRLPVRPIWPGFAINTLFDAVILWLLFAAPFALRRRLRLKRGLCPACAYPIGDSPVCTECGKPVTARSIEPARSP